MPSMRSVVAVADFVRFFLPLPNVLEIYKEISPHSIPVTINLMPRSHYHGNKLPIQTICTLYFPK